MSTTSLRVISRTQNWAESALKHHEEAFLVAEVVGSGEDTVRAERPSMASDLGLDTLERNDHAGFRRLKDLTAPRDALLGLVNESDRIHVDHGLTETNHERPGLRDALAACRGGDTRCGRPSPRPAQ